MRQIELHRFNKCEASDVGVDTEQLPQPSQIGREAYVPPDAVSEGTRDEWNCVQLGIDIFFCFVVVSWYCYVFFHS
jgi:hypothetical protein